MRHAFALGSLGLLLCLPLERQAQQDKAQQERAQQDKAEKFVLEAGEHGLLDLIERSGKFLDRFYLVDKAQSPGLDQAESPYKISILRRMELDKAGCEEVVGQLLYGRGWIAVTTDAERGIYDWIWEGGPRGQDIKKSVRKLTATEILGRPKVMDYIATTVELKHANAQIVAANLRQFFGDPRGLEQILPLGNNTQGLLLTGMRPHVARLLKILAECDVPQPDLAPYLEQRLQNIEARLGRLEAALKQDKR